MAVLQQERHVELVVGAPDRYVVTSLMFSATIPTQLPHLQVFALQINNRTDPTDDTLARVATLADLSLQPRTRDAALATAPGTGQVFLSQSCVLAFATLTEALAGAQAMQDRVNQLINDWVSFNANFNAPSPTPANITLPTGSPSQKQALINAYTVAKQAGYAQLQVKNAADATATAAQAAVTALQAQVTTLLGFSASSTLNATEMNGTTAAFTTLKTAGDTFFGTASCAAGGDKTTFQNALNVGANQENLNTGYVSDAATLHSSISTYLTTVQGLLTTANTALTAATTNQITQAATLTTDDATTAAALAALLALVPDFTPSIIPYVPG